MRTLRPYNSRHTHAHTRTPTHTLTHTHSHSLCVTWTHTHMNQQRSWPLEMPTVPTHLSIATSPSNSTCELRLNCPPPSPPVRPEREADQSLMCPMAEPSVLCLRPSPVGHVWPLKPHFSDVCHDLESQGKGWWRVKQRTRRVEGIDVSTAPCYSSRCSRHLKGVKCPEGKD